MNTALVRTSKMAHSEYDEDALQREIIKKQPNGYYEDPPVDSTSDFKELVFNFTILGLENPVSSVCLFFT